MAIVSKDDGSSFISLQKISRSKTPSIHRPGSPPVKIPSLHSESGLTLVLPDSLQNSISAQDSCNPTSGISKTTDSCTLKQSAHSGLSLAPSIGCQPNPFSIHNYMTSGLMLLPEGSSTNRPVVTPVNSTESIPQQVENHPTSDELTRIIQKPPSSRNTSIDEKASIHPCVTNLTHIDIDSSVFQSCESDALSNDLNGVGDQKWNTALSNNPTSSRMSILPETFLSRNIINKNSLLLEMESKENPTRVSRQLMEIVDDLKRFPFSIQLTPFDLKQYQQRNEQFEYIPGMSVKYSDMVISINDNKYLKERYKSVNHLSIYEMNKDMSYMVTCEVLVSNTKRYHRLYCEWRSNHRNGRVVIVDEKGSLIMLCLINRGLLQDVLIELQDGCLSSLFICNQGNCFQFISFLTLHREPWYYYSMIEYQREPLQIRMFHPENQLIYEGSVRNCLKECFPFEGEGVYYQENQAVYSGLWKDGRPETPCEDVVHVDITCNYEELFDRVLREDCNRKLNGIKRLSLASKTTKRRWRLWACLVVVVAMVVGLLHFVFNKTEGSACTKDHIVYMNNNHWWGCVDNHTTAGYGILYDSNKNVLFEGESYHDLYDGEGTVYEVIERWIDEESFIIKEESVKLYEGNWKAGKLMNGRIYQPSLYQQYGRDVLVYDGSFVDGLKDGDGMEYWPDGSIRFRGSYRKGEMWEGQMYSSNGMLVYEGMITGPTFEVNHLEELNRLNPFIESLILHIITEEECEVNLHNATNVKSIVISAGSLSHANRLVIENLPSLTTVQLQSQILIPHPHYSKEQYHQLHQNESRILFIQHNPQLLTLSLNGRSMTEISQLCLASMTE